MDELLAWEHIPSPLDREQVNVSQQQATSTHSQCFTWTQGEWTLSHNAKMCDAAASSSVWELYMTVYTLHCYCESFLPKLYIYFLISCINVGMDSNSLCH